MVLKSTASGKRITHSLQTSILTSSSSSEEWARRHLTVHTHVRGTSSQNIFCPTGRRDQTITTTLKLKDSGFTMSRRWHSEFRNWVSWVMISGSGCCLWDSVKCHSGTSGNALKLWSRSPGDVDVHFSCRTTKRPRHAACRSRPSRLLCTSNPVTKRLFSCCFTYTEATYGLLLTKT